MTKHRCLGFSLLVLCAGLAWACLLRDPVGAQEAAASIAEETPLVGMWGAQSRIESRSYLKITTPEEMTERWLAHLGEDEEKHSAYYNTAGVPDVDFSRCMVIAIFQGRSWNSAGVQVRSILEEDDRIVVRYDDRSYQTAGPDGGGVRVAAFGFFVLPKSPKPVVIEENVQGLIGEPPLWKERVTL